MTATPDARSHPVAARFASLLPIVRRAMVAVGAVALALVCAAIANRAPVLLVMAVVVLSLGAAFPARGAGIRIALISVPAVPLLRRILAGDSGYTANDPLVLLPYLLVLPTLLALFRTPRHDRPRAVEHLVTAYVLLTVATGLLGGLLTSLAQTLPYVVFQAVPMLLALAILRGVVATPLGFISRFLMIGAPVVAVYGIAQYFAPPAWDIAWLTTQHSSLLSLGSPVAREFRIWATMDSPLSLSVFLGCSLCFMLARVLLEPPGLGRSLLLAVGMVLVLVALFLTSVRTVFFALPLALLAILLVVGDSRIRARLAVLVAVAVVVLALLPQLAAVAGVDVAFGSSQSRLDLFNLDGDVSYQARSALLPQFVSALLRPVGTGTGTSFSGAQGIDNGYLSIATEQGFVGGAVFAALLVLLIAAASRSVRTGRLSVLSFGGAAAVFFMLAAEASAPVVQGLLGIIFWPIAATLLAARRDEPAGTGLVLSTPRRPNAAARFSAPLRPSTESADRT